MMSIMASLAEHTDISLNQFAQRVRTAVAARWDTKQAVHGIQSTKCWTVALRARPFGMDAELCGCALLGGKSLWQPHECRELVSLKFKNHHPTLAPLVVDEQHG
jgi:hypothetical protein